MIAFKFLGAGAVGPFTGFRWPVPSSGVPGAWDEVASRLELLDGAPGDDGGRA